jgi:hypothetical protein
MKKTILTSLLFSVIVMSCGDAVDSKSTDSATVASKPAEDAKAKEWQLVTEFKNNGQKNSQTFNLSGGEVKVEYDYKSDIDDMGLFYVYLMDKGTDLNQDGGLPDITSDQSKDKSESFLHKTSGEYYIAVNAQGKYDIKIFEKK